MTQITEEQIAEIERLLAKATGGPWQVDGSSVIVSVAPWPVDDGPEWHDWPASPSGDLNSRFVGETRTADPEGERCAALIAALRNAAPALLSAARLGIAAAQDRAEPAPVMRLGLDLDSAPDQAVWVEFAPGGNVRFWTMDPATMARRLESQAEPIPPAPRKVIDWTVNGNSQVLRVDGEVAGSITFDPRFGYLIFKGITQVREGQTWSHPEAARRLLKACGVEGTRS